MRIKVSSHVKRFAKTQIKSSQRNSVSTTCRPDPDTCTHSCFPKHCIPLSKFPCVDSQSSLCDVRTEDETMNGVTLAVGESTPFTSTHTPVTLDMKMSVVGRPTWGNLTPCLGDDRSESMYETRTRTHSHSYESEVPRGGP